MGYVIVYITDNHQIPRKYRKGYHSVVEIGDLHNGLRYVRVHFIKDYSPYTIGAIQYMPNILILKKNIVVSSKLIG